jgi:valyl-tRNA synthetase
MRAPLETGEISIIPNYFDKTYFHWIDNLRDWCISRQIWYGHRIPVWYRSADAQGEETYVGIDAPEGEGWQQDEDTLDTWFSSALWTFSTLGWPEKTEDLRNYHPTALMETGYEILFFWVARMILMSEYHLGEIPFSTIYLHGTVRDDKGRKMSKSLGNGIDPLDVAKEFGADAGRMALIVGTAPGTDSKVSKDKIKGYKNFANKVWNITRFVLSNLPENFEPKAPHLDEDIKELEEEIRELTRELNDYRIHNAAERVYHYIWHTFADRILEESKKVLFDESASEEARDAVRQKLAYILTCTLKMLHPFMPFVTEEIWQDLPWQKETDLLMVSRWPLLR